MDERICRTAAEQPSCSMGPLGRLRFVTAELKDLAAELRAGRASRAEQRPAARDNN